MSRPIRPFDVKPAVECLICGTPIAGGAYCLQCEPLSAHLGDDAWVRFRWFSGPGAETRKKCLAVRENFNRAVVGTLAAVCVVAVVGQVLFQPAVMSSSTASRQDKIGAQRLLKEAAGAKRPLNAVTIS